MESKPETSTLPEKDEEVTLRHRTNLRKLFGSDKGVQYIDKRVAIAGWVKTIRIQGRGSFAFLKLNDGLTFAELQVVVDKETPGWEFIESHKVAISASVFVIGTIISSPGKGQLIEMKATTLRLCGESSATDYPLAGKAHTVKYLREVTHLRPRTQLISSVTRIRNALAYATHKYFQDMGYFYIHTPIVTASDCEGAGEMFQVSTLMMEKGKLLENTTDIPVVVNKETGARTDQIDYSKDFFKRPAFLTVSGQLNAEIYACSMGSVYTFGPTFRAEDSHTRRHLAEFWMIEPEIAFADLFEDMDIAEGYVRYTLKYVLETCSDELKFLENYEKQQLLDKKRKIAAKQKKEAEERKARGEPPLKKQKLPDVYGFRRTPLVKRVEAVANAEFARVTYTDAIDILLKSGVEFEETPFWGIDMGSEHETWLAETHFKRPTIVYDYPKDFKAFYMRLNDDKKTVAAMDVLVPGIGELIGGSQREERLDVLLERLKEKGLDEELYSWYLDLRRYGTVVHSGFGLGFERLVCYATGVKNIREVIPFPRWPGNAEF